MTQINHISNFNFSGSEPKRLNKQSTAEISKTDLSRNTYSNNNQEQQRKAYRKGFITGAIFAIGAMLMELATEHYLDKQADKEAAELFEEGSKSSKKAGYSGPFKWLFKFFKK